MFGIKKLNKQNILDNLTFYIEDNTVQDLIENIYTFSNVVYYNNKNFKYNFFKSNLYKEININRFFYKYKYLLKILKLISKLSIRKDITKYKALIYLIEYNINLNIYPKLLKNEIYVDFNYNICMN